LVIYNLKKALGYNPGWSRAQKLLAVAYEKDGQYQKAILELQQYQQISDPAERDSIQRQIDRLITVVSTKGESAGDKNDTVGSDGSVVSTGVVSPSENEKKAGTVPTDTLTGKQKSAVKKRSSVGDPTASVSSLDVETQFLKAVEYYNQEKFDDALKLLRTVFSLDPKHSGAFYYAGLIRYRKKQNQMAVVNLQKGISYPEFGHNAHYYLGKIYGEDKHYAQAITHLFKYIEQATYEPGKKEAEQLIDSYRQKGGTAVLDAIAPGPPLQTAAADTVSPREQYFTLEVRIDSLLTMVTIDTLSDAGRKMLEGIHAFTAGAYDDAIQEFKKVLSANPSGTIAVQCLYNTGISYLKMRLFKEADNQFQQILERNPNHPLASNSLFLKSLTYLERSEPVVAEKLLRTFIQKYRKHPWIANAFEKLGDAYCDLEQQKKAVDSYSQAVPLTQKNSDKVAMLFKLGKVYSETGNGPRAMEAFNRAIETGEKENLFIRVPDSYYRIADELYKMKEYTKSLEYYKKVTRKYPSFQETPWGLFQIGSINKNLKKYQDAIDAFKELMRRYPDDYWARQAQWKMEDAVWEHEYKAVLR
jgi:tetratricopeptide (TPR) repeat protein